MILNTNKYRKNQADNLAAVENRFILDFGADFSCIYWCLVLLTCVRLFSRSYPIAVHTLSASKYTHFVRIFACRG